MIGLCQLYMNTNTFKINELKGPRIFSWTFLIELNNIIQMKFNFLIILAFLCFACQSNEISKTSADHSSEKSSNLSDELNQYFQALTDLGKFNGVVCLAQDNKIVLHEAYNLKEANETSLMVHKKNQFDVHSVSKLMANYLLMRMESQGIIKYNDPIIKYIQDFPNGEQISINHLINHTSGLPRDFSHFDGVLIHKSPEEIVELIKQEPLLANPGEKQQYSNLGYQLLYFIIGKIHDKSFEDYLITEFFEPLQMNDSGARYHTKSQKMHSMAMNHEMEDNGIKQIENVQNDEFSQSRIFSTAEDLQIMLSYFRANEDASTLAKDDIIQQSGGSDGVRVHVYTDVLKDIDWVMLCNFDGIPFEQTLQDVSNLLNGEPYKMPRVIKRVHTTLDKTILKRYEGKYSFPDMNKLSLEIKEVNGQLMVNQEGEEPTKLFAENEHTFFVDPDAAESFEFILNKDGKYDLQMGWRGIKLKGFRQ